MNNKFLFGYGIAAFFILAGAIVWFSLSISSEADQGALEAERSFSWISREAASTALSDGFLSDIYIKKLTEICQKSKMLSAVVITTPSGAVFAWPKQSSSIQYDIEGNPQISNKSIFMKVFSSNLDIGERTDRMVVITAVLYILHPDAIFAASRNSFLVILTLLLVTFIVILAQSLFHDKKPEASGISVTEYSRPSSDTYSEETDSAYHFDDYSISSLDDTVTDPGRFSGFASDEETPRSPAESGGETVPRQENPAGPEGLFSPHTGIGWEQYLTDRLDAELVRAASSEQDLSLIIIRVSGLLHTDLLSKKIAQVLLDTFKFRDLVFEYGSNGFAGILQNVHLDQAMKIADALYAGIDSILMELAYGGQITIGITTRTARLIPAFRMIEEAVSAAQKAVEEPSLPIVAFRANPEKYRNYVAEKI